MIPLAVDPRDRIDDSQALSDEVGMEMPGEVYATENAAPRVGEPERSDRALERRSRPGDVRASGRRRREAMRLLIDAGHLEMVPRGSPGAAAALLRRARDGTSRPRRPAASVISTASSRWRGSPRATRSPR